MTKSIYASLVCLFGLMACSPILSEGQAKDSPDETVDAPPTATIAEDIVVEAPKPKTYPRYVLAADERFLEVVDMKIPVLEGLRVTQENSSRGASFFYPMIIDRPNGRNFLVEYRDIIRGFGFQPTHRQTLETAEYVRYDKNDCKDTLIMYSSPISSEGYHSDDWATATQELISFDYRKAACSVVEGPMRSTNLFAREEGDHMSLWSYELAILDDMFIATERFPDIGLDKNTWIMKPTLAEDGSPLSSMADDYEAHLLSDGFQLVPPDDHGVLYNRTAPDTGCITRLRMYFTKTPKLAAQPNEAPPMIYEELQAMSREDCP